MMLGNILKLFIPIAIRLPPVQKTTRKILYENADISVVCIRWKKNDGISMHDHHGRCLFKVLDGTLLEKRWNINRVLNIDNYSSIDKGYKHSIHPLKDSKTLHVYSPPPPKK